MSDRSTRRTTTSKGYQYDDWTCLMCQNLNYSFRKTCNRCRIQTKENNDYLIEFYQASAYLELNCYSQETQNVSPNPEKESSAYGQDSFPKFLFLELNCEDVEETSFIRREMPEQETPVWINCLIGE